MSVDGRIIASGSTTSDLVRITQTGTGNAFVVEDSANPDTTMFVITSAGDVGIGATTPASKLYVSANNTQTYAIQGSSTILGGYGGKFFGYNGGFFEGAGNGAGTSTLSYGLFASAHDSITNIAVLGIADNNESYIATTNIGGHFIAENAVNNYSLRLQDGTAGINKLLVDVTGNGEANWTSSIKVTSIIASASSTSDIIRITQTGTGNALVVEDSVNPDLTPFVITNSGNVGIGTPSPSYSVHIIGTMSTSNLVINTGASNGYVLTSDANGNATWQPGGATITNYGNNRVVTSDGTTTGLVGETNMTFDGSTLIVTATNSTTATLIIASGSTTSDLVRITQTGTGNAFVVEDSVNPDSSSFVINNIGQVGVGISPTSLGSKLYVYSPTAAETAIKGNSIFGTGVFGEGAINYYGVHGQSIADGAGTVTGVYGVASGAEGDNSATTFIGGKFISTSNGGGSTQVYSLWLQDGTEATDKILTSITSDGKANWKSSIKVTSVAISNTPTYSSTNTQILTRNSSSGEIEYSDSTSPRLFNYGASYVMSVFNYLT